MLTQAGVTGRKPADANMDMREFCAWGRISKTTAYEEIAAGRLKVVYVGRKPIITPENRQAWRDSLPSLPTSRAKAA
jgi:hypothetical protein